MALKSGASYQKLLNQVLKDGLKRRTRAEAKPVRIEKELEQLKLRKKTV